MRMKESLQIFCNLTISHMSPVTLLQRLLKLGNVVQMYIVKFVIHSLRLLFLSIILCFVLLVGWRSLVITQMQSTLFLKALSESFSKHVLCASITAVSSDVGLGHLCHSVWSATIVNTLKNGRASL